MKKPEILTLFLCGDVMIGRGVDQILPHPGDPTIHEDYLKDATEYVELAEARNGVVSKPVDFQYIWGESLQELDRIQPQVRIINLETSITTSNDWEYKGINYRMHPVNVPSLTVAGIDVCALANNHVLDWGAKGLHETLNTLHEAGIKTSGAGLDIQEARAPAIVDLSPLSAAGPRILVFSIGTTSSGVPSRWAASSTKAGVNFVADLSLTTLNEIKKQIQDIKRPRDIVVLSIHWGENWGYSISSEQRSFAQNLLTEAGVDIVHGHSSHHIQGIEVYQNKLIIYGCGDFINDYEGIRGYEEYRGDLSVMFFPSVEVETGELVGLHLVPMHLRKFRLEKAMLQDVQWIKKILDREGKKWNTRFMVNPDLSIEMNWDKASGR